MDSDYRWLVTAGLVTSSGIAVTANTFLLVIFGRRRGLRTVPNRFVINLLITNLLSSILLIPLLLIDQETNNLMEGTPKNLSASSIAEVVIQEEEILSKSGSVVIEGDDNVEIIETSEGVLKDQSFPSDTQRMMLCYFAQGTTSFVCTASIFSILLIGVNQYFGVIHSLRYHFYINKCRATIFIASSWVAALLCAIMSSLTYSDSSLWDFCEKPTEKSEWMMILNTVYAVTYFTVIILAPFVAICVIYVCIYTAAHQSSERMRKSHSATSSAPLDYVQIPVETSAKKEGLPKVQSAPNLMENQANFKVGGDDVESQVKRTSSERGTLNFINNLKHKISNASMFRYREETRAAKISILVILMVLICYIPYGLTLVLSADCIDIQTPQIFNNLSLVLLVLSNILSPFLFGYRNKRIKREIAKMFGLVPSSVPRLPETERCRRVVMNKSFENVGTLDNHQPFLHKHVIPEVIVTCKPDNEKKSILKRVCNSTTWSSYKKCNFITVPDSCLGEARGSFSSTSTQVSTEE